MLNYLMLPGMNTGIFALLSNWIQLQILPILFAMGGLGALTGGIAAGGLGALVANISTGLGPVAAKIGLPVVSEIISGKIEKEGLDLETRIQVEQLEQREKMAQRDIELTRQYAATEEAQYQRKTPFIMGERKALWGTTGVELKGGSPVLSMRQTQKELQRGFEIMKQRHAADIEKSEMAVQQIQTQIAGTKLLGAYKQKERKTKTTLGAIEAGVEGLFDIAKMIGGFFI